tara:strand:+ start:48630 stop:49472 length:843 start_codon:yes stop_codon:yes gene_type:complete
MKQTFDINSVPVAYADDGRADGEPFVLVHGAGANRNYWKLLAAEIVAVRDRPRIVAPDLFGHGQTPPWLPAPQAGDLGGKGYAYADDVALLAQLATKIRGPFDLIGHSSGGAICLEYALLHPDRVRKLVVAEPMLPGILADQDPPAYAEVASAYEAAHRAVAAGDDEAAARCLFEYILGDASWSKLAPSIRQWMTANVACTLAAHSQASLSLRVPTDRYRAIACPVMVVVGESTRGPFRRVCELVAASLPDVRTRVIAGARHNAPLTHARAVNEAILAFL